MPPPEPVPAPEPVPPPEPVPAPVVSPPSAPAVLTRADWGAKPYKGTPVPQPRYDFLVLHHAAGFHADTEAEGLARMRDIQRLHQDDRGWSDIGYHFLVDSAGRVYQGRPYAQSLPLDQRPNLVIGAHVAGQNTGKVGVCVLGCYHAAANGCDDAVTPEALHAVVHLMAFLCHRYGIAPDHLRGHRDFLGTDCPGDTLYALLPTIRDQVQALLP